MISLGGIIGAGLFFGSGPIINAVGLAAGLSVGRLYACFWIIVVAVEAQASAPIPNAFFPSIPQWLLALGLMLLLTATNPISAGSFGGFEFWFAMIKVFAIIAFITLGSLSLFGLWLGAELNFSTSPLTAGSRPTGTLSCSPGSSRSSSRSWGRRS